MKLTAMGRRAWTTPIFGGIVALAVITPPGPAGAAIAEPATVAEHTASARPVLRHGMSGTSVSELQRRLRVPTVSGYFGALTKEYVRSFQMSAGMRPSGVVGLGMWQALGSYPTHSTAAVTATSQTLKSAVLGTRSGTGRVAAPIKNFRDGGHAYYLYGKGLHSCAFTGKCMDLFAATGEPVFAFADGTLVVPPYAANSFGNHVVITHRDGTQSVYAHLSEVVARPGPVAAGTLLGTVGCTGTSADNNGCARAGGHLHFEWSGLTWRGPGDPGQAPPFFSRWRLPPR